MQNLVLSNAVRSAVVAWAKTLARATASAGITVNNILTGNFETERLDQMHRAQSERKGVSLDEYKQAVKKEIPAGRFGEPEEFGHLVAFLASGFASYITGASIPIDGECSGRFNWKHRQTCSGNYAEITFEVCREL